jgi:hypothetical protein
VGGLDGQERRSGFHHPSTLNPIFPFYSRGFAFHLIAAMRGTRARYDTKSISPAGRPETSCNGCQILSVNAGRSVQVQMTGEPKSGTTWLELVTIGKFFLLLPFEARSSDCCPAPPCARMLSAPLPHSVSFHTTVLVHAARNRCVERGAKLRSSYFRRLLEPLAGIAETACEPRWGNKCTFKKGIPESLDPVSGYKQRGFLLTWEISGKTGVFSASDKHRLWPHCSVHSGLDHPGGFAASCKYQRDANNTECPCGHPVVGLNGTEDEIGVHRAVGPFLIAKG